MKLLNDTIPKGTAHMEETSKNKKQTALAEHFIKNGYVEFEVSGKSALFADPLISAGGEKTSYSVPTYEALKGITESIYWKPTLTWVIDKVRVMNRVQTEEVGTKLRKFYTSGSDKSPFDLANFTYLRFVRYQVQAHIEWNTNRPEYEKDRDFRKHYSIFAKWLLRGGRRSVYLGKSECYGSVSRCTFGDGEGYYDNSGTINIGIMYHGITYPDEVHGNDAEKTGTFDIAPVIMQNGVIRFARPEECMHQKLSTRISVKSDED